MSIRRPVWEEQAVNTNKMEVVADPIFPPYTSSLQSGSLPSSGSIFARPQSSPVAAVASPIPGCSTLGERICRKLLCSVALLC